MHETRWYFYLARCRDDSLYAGITTDLKRRAVEHNEGTGAKYTRSRRPVTLVWWERFGSKSAAAQREAEVKKWGKSRKEHLITIRHVPQVCQ
jgi:putative endonuclease